MLLPFSSSYLPITTLSSYSNNKYKKYLHCKRKEEPNLKINILHQLKENYFPYLLRNQYKEEEIMHLIP
jgi:hypothetical protein